MKIDNTKDYFDNSIVIILHKLNHHIYNKHNEILAKYDITIQQSKVLKFILIHGKNNFVNQKDIEKFMDLKGSSISSLVKNMIDKGFITKTQNPADGRYYNLSVTAKGIELDKISFNIFKDFNFNLVEGINEADLNHFKNILKMIDNNLDK